MSDTKNRFDIKNAISGVLVVDKPVGMTSHDVVQVIRRGTNIRRAGHTGTLDPRASGVLVVLIGPAVRLSEYVSASDKRYQAVVRLGSSTDTYDSEGKIINASDTEISETQFEEALNNFVGEIEQVPPPYSAVKVKGKKADGCCTQGKKISKPHSSNKKHDGCDEEQKHGRPVVGFLDDQQEKKEQYSKGKQQRARLI